MRTRYTWHFCIKSLCATRGAVVVCLRCQTSPVCYYKIAAESARPTALPAIPNATCSRCFVGKSIAPQIRGGCDTFGPMMIVDGWWQSPARATPVNIGHMALDACVGVGSGQWLLIEVCGKKLFDLCVDAWITRRPSLWMLSCDANAMESGVFTVKSVRIFSDLNMNISLLNDPHNEIRLYNLLNYMWNLVLAWYIT